jgi:hypothetical protein
MAFTHLKALEPEDVQESDDLVVAHIRTAIEVKVLVCSSVEKVLSLWRWDGARDE